MEPTVRVKDNRKIIISKQTPRFFIDKIDLGIARAQSDAMRKNINRK